MDPFYKGLVFEEPCFLWNTASHVVVSVSPQTIEDRRRRVHLPQMGDSDLSPVLNTRPLFTRSSLAENPANPQCLSVSSRIGCLYVKRPSASHTTQQKRKSQHLNRVNKATFGGEASEENGNLCIAPLNVDRTLLAPERKRSSAVGQLERVALESMAELETVLRKTIGPHSIENETFFTQFQRILKSRFLKALEMKHTCASEVHEAQMLFLRYLKEGISTAELAQMPDQVIDRLKRPFLESDDLSSVWY